MGRTNGMGRAKSMGHADFGMGQTDTHFENEKDNFYTIH